MKALSILQELKKGYSIYKNDVDDAIEELEALQDRSCDNCKHYEPIIRNGTFFKRCLYLGTVGDIGYCGRFEPKDKE